MKTDKYYENMSCICDHCSTKFTDLPSEEKIIIYQKQNVGEGIPEQMVHLDLCPHCQDAMLTIINEFCKRDKPDFTNHDGSFDYDFVPDEVEG